ncbi:MAG: shikimate kinase [Flavobacteriales bacterium]|nr:shikimate kinase [Flavobacteriales bacterium]
MRVVLTGPMCAGTSRVGRALAERLGLPFDDLDRLAEQRIGGAIAPFFAREGEHAFRQLERELLLEWLSVGGPGVLATGGGTLVDPGNMDAALREATVVMLSVGEEELVRRVLRAGRDRPLYLGLDDDGVRQRTHELLHERAPHYARATVTVDAEAPVEEVVRRIILAIGAAQES